VKLLLVSEYRALGIGEGIFSVFKKGNHREAFFCIARLTRVSYLLNSQSKALQVQKHRHGDGHLGSLLFSPFEFQSLFLEAPASSTTLNVGPCARNVSSATALAAFKSLSRPAFSTSSASCSRALLCASALAAFKSLSRPAFLTSSVSRPRDSEQPGRDRRKWTRLQPAAMLSLSRNTRSGQHSLHSGPCGGSLEWRVHTESLDACDPLQYTTTNLMRVHS
jgi:hypothetical protein